MELYLSIKNAIKDIEAIRHIDLEGGPVLKNYPAVLVKLPQIPWDELSNSVIQAETRFTLTVQLKPYHRSAGDAPEDVHEELIENVSFVKEIKKKLHNYADSHVMNIVLTGEDTRKKGELVEVVLEYKCLVADDLAPQMPAPGPGPDPEPSSDASLAGLFIDGILVDGFHPDTTQYNIELPEETTQVPVVAATASDENASVNIIDAEGLPGTTTVEVTAEDGVTTRQYGIAFTVAEPEPSSDASLAGLFIDGILVDGFHPDTTQYNIELPEETTQVPVVAATASDENATVDIIDAEGLPGTTTVEVTAEDGVTTRQYGIAFTVAEPAPDIDLLNGLISYYQLDETEGQVLDIHGNNNSADFSATRGGSGILANCYSFNGSSDFINLPTSDFDNLELLTISLWIRPMNIEIAFARIIHKGDDSGNTKGFLLVQGSSAISSENSIIFVFQNDYTTGQVSIKTPELSNNQWYHLVAIYDGSECSVYINGVNVSEAVINSAWGSGVGNNFSIAKRAGQNNSWFEGDIDELVFFNQALLPEEISALFNQGNGKPYSEF